VMTGGRQGRFDGIRFSTASQATGEFPSEFDRHTSTGYCPLPALAGAEKITGDQDLKMTDSELGVPQGMTEYANRLIHRIPTSTTPGSARTTCPPLTPLFALDWFIGMGNEGRSQK
jgi:hypothetical protein